MGDYKFESDFDIESMVGPLNAAGPWKWQFRDSDSEGFYLSATGTPGKTKIRIIEESPGYAIEITIYDDTVAANQEELIDRVIRERILPAIGAKNARMSDT